MKVGNNKLRKNKLMRRWLCLCHALKVPTITLIILFLPLLIVTFVFHVVGFDQLSIQKLLLPRSLHVVRFALNYHFMVIGVKGARKSLIWTDRCKHAGQRTPFIVSPIA